MMIDFFYISADDIKRSFLMNSTEQNIDNLVHTITADRDCSDAYKDDLRSWLELLVQTSK